MNWKLYLFIFDFFLKYFPTYIYARSKADCPVPEVYIFLITCRHLFFNDGQLI